MNNSRPLRMRRGFALLLVLLLLALTAAAVSGLVVRSLRRAGDAVRAEEQLQHQWGVVTVEAALLAGRAETMLRRREMETGRPVPTLEITFILGRQDFAIRVSDEQAKLNVNGLYHRRGLRDTETAVRNLLAASNTPLSIKLVPAGKILAGLNGPYAQGFGSFGQILKNEPLSMLSDSQHIGAIITCWGDGKLNAGRATREVIREACRGMLDESDIDELLRMRRAGRPLRMDDVTKRMQMPQNKAQFLQNFFTDQSTCHSLWITDRIGDRDSYDFIACDESVAGQPQWTRLTW